jgi:hypothetical protein
MASIRRMTLGLVLGIACGVGGLATLPAAAQVVVGDYPDCNMGGMQLPPGAAIACGEPGGMPSAMPDASYEPALPNLPPAEGPTYPTGLPCESGLAAILKCAP